MRPPRVGRRALPRRKDTPGNRADSMSTGKTGARARRGRAATPSGSAHSCAKRGRPAGRALLGARGHGRCPGAPCDVPKQDLTMSGWGPRAGLQASRRWAGYAHRSAVQVPCFFLVRSAMANQSRTLQGSLCICATGVTQIPLFSPAGLPCGCAFHPSAG